jgi:hypothetical protein
VRLKGDLFLLWIQSMSTPVGFDVTIIVMLTF